MIAVESTFPSLAILSQAPSVARSRCEQCTVAERSDTSGRLGEGTLTAISARRRHGPLQDAATGTVYAHRYRRALEIERRSAAARDQSLRVASEKGEAQEADGRVTRKDAVVRTPDLER